LCGALLDMAADPPFSTFLVAFGFSTRVLLLSGYNYS